MRTILRFFALFATTVMISSYSPANGDWVLSLLEYRGTHVKFKREAVWQEAWIARLSEGQIVESWPIIDQSSLLRHLGYQFVPPSS